MQVDLNRLLNRNHKEFFQSTAETVLLYGGANAGKSFSVVDKFIVQMILQRRKLRVLVVRKSMPSLKRTCLYIIQRRLGEFGIAYKYHSIDMVITIPDLCDSQFIFVSVNNIYEIEKIKSITDIDFIWLEEGTELMVEAADQAVLRLRGGKSSWAQLVLSFNPSLMTSWVYSRHFEDRTDAHIIKVTVDDNPWASPEELARLNALKHQNYNLYKVYRLGEWGTLEGYIYSWPIIDAIPEGERIVDTWYAHDWGYAKPCATVKFMMSGEGNIYLQQVLYAAGLITPMQIKELKTAGVGRDIIYADDADPGRIEEARLGGLVVLPAEKAVEDGISYVQGLPNVFLLSDSVDMEKEMKSYCLMKDKNGNFIEGKPVKFRDHLMDAARYGLFSHRHNIRSVSVVKEAIKPKPAPWYAPQTTVTRKAMAI